MNKKINVLVACQESQRVCIEFRNLGFNAYSCDVKKCSGGHPEWHILDNCLSVINGGDVRLQNMKWISIDRWDLIIAHPPCTYLSNVSTGAHSLNKEKENRIEGRTLNRIEAMRFFMECVRANCNHIAIENPVGVMNTVFRKPDQIINPYQFAESEDDTENYVTKRTCLWLKNLPTLETNDLEKPDNKKLLGSFTSGKIRTWEDTCARVEYRSKTFSGIAKAMANQWGTFVEGKVDSIEK